MKLRKSLKNLINGDGTITPELEEFKQALIDLKNPVANPSLIAGAQADGAESRFDDFVWIHYNLMVGHAGMGITGPHDGHRGPGFFPWHREYIKRFEAELQTVSGNPDLTIPYWDFTVAQESGDPGYPFIANFIGGDGSDAQNDEVTNGPFAEANGWQLNLEALDPAGDQVELKPGAPFPLRRRFGEQTGGQGLPTPTHVRNGLQIATYDVSPWNRNSDGGVSFRNVIEGYDGPGEIHNIIHQWVGGSLFPSTSPNDPVFWLLHCNVDRLWAVWMQKHPGVAQYLPTGMHGPVDPHGLIRLNDDMTSLSDYFGGATTPADLLNHKPIAWYDSDLPEITLETPSLNFGDVPEGMTQYRAVRFEVRTVKSVTFRITDAPGGNFDTTSLGTTFIAIPDLVNELVTVWVWVQFLSAGGNAVQTSSVVIGASIMDEDGYHAAAANVEYTQPSWQYTIDLSARKVPRVDTAVTLVLDRSGSMSAAAGGGATRSSLMRSAVTVFFDLLRDTDEIGLVSFDDMVDTLLPITRKNMADVYSIAAGTGLDPRGSTSVGGGIERGRTVLNSATAGYQQAMLVLTDGNENTAPSIAEASDDINTRTYAIGFGLPGEVSAPALQAITQNTNGQLIITGNIGTEEQQFLLSKYFVQVLAGIVNEDIILDPQGDLTPNSLHRIPFWVTNPDISIDVVLLSPLPYFIDFTLLTPGGQQINPAVASAEASVQFIQGSQVGYYRLSLPALLSSPDGSYEGQWHAVLKLKSAEEIKKLQYESNIRTSITVADNRSYQIPYSLLVKSFSNLHMAGKLDQDAFEPGAVIWLQAELTENTVPLAGNAKVFAELRIDNLPAQVIMLERQTTGIYQTQITATQAGLYTFRLRANGYSRKGQAFTREQVLTAPVFYHRTHPGNVGGGENDRFCRLMNCLLSDEVMTDDVKKRLESIGIKIGHLKKCLLSGCKPKSKNYLQAFTKQKSAGHAHMTETGKPAPTKKITKPGRDIGHSHADHKMKKKHS